MAIGNRTISVAFLLGLTWGGCSSDSGMPHEMGREEETEYATNSDLEYEGGSTGSDNDADLPPPFSRPFEGLVMNRARWAAFEIATKAARVVRGMDDSDDFTDRAATYVEIDLDVTNTSRFDDELARRSTWDLILADGTRITQHNLLELRLAPMATVPFTLRYEVDPEIDLKGSCLELNAPMRGVVAPELIPLDAPCKADIDASLPELVGKVLESSRPDDFSRQRIEILSARASRNSQSEGRAPYGSMFVELVADVTILDDFRDTNIQNEDFTAVVGGKVLEPYNFINELVPVNTTERVTIVFNVTDDVRDLTLRFEVGFDPDQDPEHELSSVNIHIPYEGKTPSKP